MLTLLLQICCSSCRLRWDHIKGEDQVARIVGLADRIADVDVKDARVLSVEADQDIGHLDARLPASQRLPDGCGHAGGGLRNGAVEDIVMNRAAKLRAHRPLADGGAEDQPDAFLDFLLARNQGDPSGRVRPEGERPAGADEFFAHCAITFVWPADPIIMGVPVGTQVPPTGGTASSPGIPPASTFVLPAAMIPLPHPPSPTAG